MEMENLTTMKYHVYIFILNYFKFYLLKNQYSSHVVQFSTQQPMLKILLQYPRNPDTAPSKFITIV